MRALPLLALASCGIIAVSNSAAAQSSECYRVLIPDTVDIRSSTEISLAILQELQSTSSQNFNRNIAATYGDISLTSSQARELQSSLTRTLNLEYVSDQRYALMISHLSGDTLNAFRSCMRDRQALSYNFGGIDVTSRDTIPIQIVWNPQPAPTDRTQRGTALILQDRPEAETIVFSVDNGQNTTIAVTRDRYKPAAVIIDVGGLSQIIDIPAASTFRLVDIQVDGAQAHFGARETTGDVGGTVCVSLDNDNLDTILIPGTFKLRFERRQTTGWVNITEHPPQEASRSVCQRIEVLFREVWSTFADVRVNGYMQAIRVVNVGP